MPSLDTFAKFGEFLFSFNYTQIIERTDLFANCAEQIEYLLFVISEAKRVINIFNLYENGTILLLSILAISPALESGFLSLLKKIGDKNISGIKTSHPKESYRLSKADTQYYEYIDNVKATLSLLETELGYRKGLHENILRDPVYNYKQEELFVNETELIPKIKWLGKKEQLLKLFSQLNENGFVGTYKTEQIIDHFLVENPMNRINYFLKEDKKFQWLGSDNEFCFLINRLVKKKLVPSHKKYKIMGSHFINREGSNFKYLAQKHNFSKNYLQSKPTLIAIVDKVQTIK